MARQCTSSLICLLWLSLLLPVAFSESESPGLSADLNDLVDSGLHTLIPLIFSESNVAREKQDLHLLKATSCYRLISSILYEEELTALRTLLNSPPVLRANSHAAINELLYTHMRSRLSSERYQEWEYRWAMCEPDFDEAASTFDAMMRQELHAAEDAMVYAYLSEEEQMFLFEDVNGKGAGAREKTRN